ncbi:hypothetical protein [Sediminibacterium sp.]|uniref:hypothetical protein n=1 Tax=Sediminibacterium sp. TaxID=1917865 RepID=UPI00273571DB|nr:hypothetical protein [Sediminibacterium sp.]MDP3393045.1 hypothetical protein [Sediminibacterium sp.]MDP3567253.1 hypothetical protein [Sediminibacterium sp.]
MKILLTFLTFLISVFCFAQKTFRVDTSFLDTIEFKKYKGFIVSKDFDINFIGKQISQNDRFTPEKSDAIAADNAIQTQYANAALRQLDKQNNNIPTFADTAEWEKAFKIYQERRPKIIRRKHKDQKNKIQTFDRYFWGYRNADNEKLILIRFDPHKIRHYTIAGETFADVLTIMVYNINRNILSYAGWSDHKE